MIDNRKEYILCAAIARKSPRKCNPYHDGTNEICDIEIGYRHHDIIARFNDENILDKHSQGFYTSRGRFVSRREAMQIAIECGQVDKALEGGRLYSEDLYQEKIN